MSISHGINSNFDCFLKLSYLLTVVKSILKKNNRQMYVRVIFEVSVSTKQANTCQLSGFMQ
jgi:hypothetical protein